MTLPVVLREIICAYMGGRCQHGAAATNEDWHSCKRLATSCAAIKKRPRRCPVCENHSTHESNCPLFIELVRSVRERNFERMVCCLKNGADPEVQCGRAFIEVCLLRGSSAVKIAFLKALMLRSQGTGGLQRALDLPNESRLQKFLEESFKNASTGFVKKAV